MKPPIIVYGDGTLNLFRSMESAEGYFEGPDIQHVPYVAYDSQGRLLKLEAHGTQESKLFLGWFKVVDIGKVSIISKESVPSHADDLKKILQDWLKKLGTDPMSIEEPTLDALLTKTVERCGFTS